MVLDRSAILAMLLGDPEAVAMAQAVEADAVRLVSVVTVAEVATVLEARYGAKAGAFLDRLLERLGATVAPADAAQCDAVREGQRRLGVSLLGLGDWFAYGLARTTGERLLFKAERFRQTDVANVL